MISFETILSRYVPYSAGWINTPSSLTKTFLERLENSSTNFSI